MNRISSLLFADADYLPASKCTLIWNNIQMFWALAKWQLEVLRKLWNLTRIVSVQALNVTWYRNDSFMIHSWCISDKSCDSAIYFPLSVPRQVFWLSMKIAHWTKMTLTGLISKFKIWILSEHWKLKWQRKLNHVFKKCRFKANIRLSGLADG